MRDDLKLLKKELLFYRKPVLFAFLSRVLLVSIFICCGAFVLIYNTQADFLAEMEISQMMDAGASLEDGYRKGTLKYSYNLVILPNQDSKQQWLETGESPTFFSDQEISKLASSSLIWIRHLLPILQQKYYWEEKGVSLFLVGTRGETTNDHGRGKKPLVPLIAESKAILGYQVAQMAALSVGDRFILKGKEFSVSSIYPQRGSRDDLSLWVDLKSAQEILEKPGLINAAMALECFCAHSGTEAAEIKIQKELSRYLPGYQVVTMSKRSLSRRDLRSTIESQVNLLQNNLLQKRLDQSIARSQAIELFQLLAGAILVILALVLFYSFSVSAASNYSKLSNLGFSKLRLMFIFFIRTILISIIAIFSAVLFSTLVIFLFLAIFMIDVTIPGIGSPLNWFPLTGLIYSFGTVFFLDLAGVIIIFIRRRSDGTT